MWFIVLTKSLLTQKQEFILQILVCKWLKETEPLCSCAQSVFSGKILSLMNFDHIVKVPYRSLQMRTLFPITLPIFTAIWGKSLAFLFFIAPKSSQQWYHWLAHVYTLSIMVLQLHLQCGVSVTREGNKSGGADRLSAFCLRARVQWVFLT